MSYLRIKQYFLILLFLFSVIGVFQAYATPYPFQYQGARQQGMGGAFVGIADNSQSLYYNAAGLINLKENEFQFFQGTFQRGIETRNSLGTREDIANNNLSSLSLAIQDNQVLATLTDQVGLYSYINLWTNQFSYFVSWESFNFTFAPYSRSNFLININNVFDPHTRVSILVDVGIYTGVAVKIGAGLSLGATLRGFVRYEIDSVYTLAELDDSTFLKDFKSDIKGLKKNNTSSDISFFWSVPLPFELFQWSLGASFENFYTTTDDTKTLNLGTSIEWLLLDEYLAVRLGFDFRDVLYNIDSDRSLGKRLHTGLEVSHKLLYLYKFSGRVGISQGYLSYGLGVDIGEIFNLDYALFTEEIGAYAGQIGNTRQVFEFKFYY